MIRRWAPCLALLAACGETRAPREPVTASGGGGEPAVAGSPGLGAAPSSSGGSAAPSSGGSSDGGAGAPASTAGAGGADAACDFDAIADLDVFSPSWDPLGYPPYAIDGCVLVYVASEGTSGPLYRLDLATGERELLDSAEQQPRRPSVAGDVIAWERAGQEASSAVRVRAGERERTFEASGEPRATTDAVVYTRFHGADASDDTDVYLYRVDDPRDEEQPVAVGPGQQRFADVSATHVAITDFSEDPRGYFDQLSSISDVIVVERESGESISRSAPGKQAFPLLGRGGALVYLEWGAVHPEPKFGQFFLKAGSVSGPVSADINLKGQDPVLTDVAYVRPSVHDDRVDFVDRTSGVRLYSVDVAGSAPPVAVTDVDAAQLFGSASTGRAVLVAAPKAGASLRLLAVAR